MNVRSGQHGRQMTALSLLRPSDSPPSGLCSARNAATEIGGDGQPRLQTVTTPHQLPMAACA
jgi:hypothetical protein